MKVDRVKEIYEEINEFKAPSIDFSVTSPIEITEAMNKCLQYIENLYAFSVELRKDILALQNLIQGLDDDYELSLQDKMLNDPDVQKKRSFQAQKMAAEFLVRDKKSELRERKQELSNTEKLYEFIEKRSSSLTKEKASILRQWDMVRMEWAAGKHTDPGLNKNESISETKGFRGEIGRPSTKQKTEEKETEEDLEIPDSDPQLAQIAGSTGGDEKEYELSDQMKGDINNFIGQ